MKPENSILFLLSVKEYIKDVLDQNGWENEYDLIVSGSLADAEKEISIITNGETKLTLPIVAIMLGPTGHDAFEMGSSYGRNASLLRILIFGKNLTQGLSLADVLKRSLNDMSIDIRDYTSEAHTLLGVIETEEARINPIYIFGEVNTALRYQQVLEVEARFPAQKLLT